MGLLQQWELFTEEKQHEADAAEYFKGYFLKEKEFYEKLLGQGTIFKATVKELAEEFGVEIMFMTGFIDGINDSLVTPIDLDALEEDTVVELNYDKEKLYFNMVDARADWLYNLPVWDTYLSAEKRKELYKSAKSASTVVKPVKVGRNDPCPCGSGKKNKKCCKL